MVNDNGLAELLEEFALADTWGEDIEARAIKKAAAYRAFTAAPQK